MLSTSDEREASFLTMAFVKENGCPNERFSLTGKEMNKDLSLRSLDPLPASHLAPRA